MKLLAFTPYFTENKFLLMDRAYQGDNVRSLTKELGYEPIHLNPTEFISGNMTKNFTNSEMKLKDFFVVLSVSGEFLLATISRTFCIRVFAMIIDSVV